MIDKISKLMSDPSQAIKRWRCHPGRLFGQYCYKRFIVLSRNRTGSNMLISMLNSCPSIYARYEIFRMLNGNSVDSVIKRVYCKYPSFIKAVGFKIFYHHPIDDNTGYLWNKLAKMEDLHVIHLKRRNILRAVLSRKIAEVTKSWLIRNSGKTSTKLKQVYLDAAELEKAFKQTREWETSYEHIFQYKHMVEIYYEDLASNPQKEFNKVTNMLSVKFCIPKTDIKKQNPEKMSELILNYESIKKKFSKTKWSKFLEE